MKKSLHILVFFFAVLTWNQLQGQTQRTFAEIKEPVSTEMDSSKIHGQSVIVEGIVMTAPNDWYQASEANVRYSFWIQEPGKSGPLSGLQIRLNRGSFAAATGIRALTRGTRVRLIGTVDYFTGEIQLALSETDEVEIISTGQEVTAPAIIEGGILNNATKVAQVATGTQWEGSYVTLEDLSVTISGANPSRGNFTVTDSEGNTIDIWDANNDMRFRRNGFAKPSVGTSFNKISGIVYHRAFTKPGSYEIHPTQPSDLESDSLSVSPIISDILRNPVCPKADDKVTITASVIHPAAQAITRVSLLYAVGTTNGNYTSVNMTAAGDLYTAEIPAQAAASFVHYKIEAVDINGNDATGPAFSPFSYTVNDNGCTIRDIQFAGHNFFNGGATERFYDSGYLGMTVSGVRGVVTASAATDNLGYLYIQQRGQSAYAGVQLVGASIAGLAIGDSVEVSGTVREYFGHTQIDATSINKLGTATPIPAMRVGLDVLGGDVNSLAKEQVEGMLIELNETAPLKVLQVMAELQTYGAGNTNNNRLGDWRVGTDTLNKDKGVRIMTGGGSSVRASKAVGFINSTEWSASLNSGVKAIIVADTFCFEYIRGIVAHDWEMWRVQPRTDTDIKLDTTCTVVSRRAQLIPADQIAFYPNPASTEFRIESSRSLHSIEVLELTGRVLSRQNLNGSTEQRVDVSDLNTGLYIVRVTDQSGAVAHSRLLIAR